MIPLLPPLPLCLFLFLFFPFFPFFLYFYTSLYDPTQTAVRMHITLRENDGYFHRAYVFCTHVQLFSLRILQTSLWSTTKYVSVKSAFTPSEFSSISPWKLTLQMTQVVGMVQDLGRRRSACYECETDPDSSGSSAESQPRVSKIMNLL